MMIKPTNGLMRLLQSHSQDICSRLLRIIILYVPCLKNEFIVCDRAPSKKRVRTYVVGIVGTGRNVK